VVRGGSEIAKERAMNEPTMETLARRLDGVERENRRLKQVGVVALAVIAAVVLMGQATGGKVAKVIEAENFIVRDEHGRKRAELGAKSGNVGLAFYGNSGLASISLYLYQGASPSLMVVDKHRKLAAFLSPSGLGLQVKNNSRAALRLDDDGSPRLVLYDKNGMFSQNKRAALELDNDGSPKLVLYDKNGMSRAELGSTSLETTRTGVVEKRPESSLVLFDKKGKVIWSAP